MPAAALPTPILAVIADVLPSHYTHSQLDLMFIEAGAPGEAPGGNKIDKCLTWLKRANDPKTGGAAEIVGRVLEDLMEVERGDGAYQEALSKSRKRVTDVLARFQLRYQPGGRLLGSAAATPTRSLDAILRSRDLSALQTEFDRALATVEQDPAAAVTAACALVEAFCKVYCQDEQLELPKEQSIKPLWKVVQPSLGLDPASMVDDDLKRILSGLASVVDGIGAYRTHAGSAHGRGRQAYRPGPRHARLVVHSAHSLVAFAIETWDARRATKA